MSTPGDYDPEHWVDWHKPYDDPTSWLSRRLAIVQRRLSEALDAAPPGPVRVISICAGQGRDVLGVLPFHRRRDEIAARIVELDEHNASVARHAAEAVGLDQVEVVTGDAALTDAYAGAVPAAVVLACGIFGNISDEDIRSTVGAMPALCAPGASVIWTRHTKVPEVIDWIQIWFSESGFENLSFDNPEGTHMGIGVARLVRPPDPFEAGRTLFTFVGSGSP